MPAHSASLPVVCARHGKTSSARSAQRSLAMCSTCPATGAKQMRPGSTPCADAAARRLCRSASPGAYSQRTAEGEADNAAIQRVKNSVESLFGLLKLARTTASSGSPAAWRDAGGGNGRAASFT